jgi:acyl-ACP thioesterase
MKLDAGWAFNLNIRMIHTEEYSVHGTEIDYTYRLTEPHLVSLFQDAFARYCAGLGIAAYDLQRMQKTWILSDFHTVFHRALPKWHQKIKFEVWARKLQSFRIYADFKAFDELGNCCASGTSCWLILDEASRLPIDDKATFHKLGLTPKQAVEGFRFSKPEPLSGQLFEDQGKVRSSDIDFNFHLNSVRYIAVGLTTLPIDFRMKNKLNWLTIRYNQEILLDQELLSSVYLDGDKAMHLLQEPGRGIEFSRMYTQWEPAKISISWDNEKPSQHRAFPT